MDCSSSTVSKKTCHWVLSSATACYLLYIYYVCWLDRNALSIMPWVKWIHTSWNILQMLNSWSWPNVSKGIQYEVYLSILNKIFTSWTSICITSCAIWLLNKDENLPLPQRINKNINRNSACAELKGSILKNDCRLAQKYIDANFVITCFP